MELNMITCPVPAHSFTISDGDFLILRIPKNMPSEEVKDLVRNLVNHVKASRPNVDGIHIVACTEGIDICRLDPEMMRQNGWVRAPEG